MMSKNLAVTAAAFASIFILSSCEVDDVVSRGNLCDRTAEKRDVSRINGVVPPGRRAGLVNVITMFEGEDSNGNLICVKKGTRRKGTRVDIHNHDFGGHTCVLSGTITLFLEGSANIIAEKDTCYYMPPGKLMAAANLGSVDADLIDTFILPKGRPLITLREIK